MEHTEKQWNYLGYKIKKGASGVLRWNNRYCAFKTYFFNENQVEQMTEVEIKAFKKRKNHNDYVKGKERAKEVKRLDELYDNYKTSYQWLKLGYIIKDGEKHVKGQSLINMYKLNKASDYYYYYSNQVDYNPDKAKDILHNVEWANNYDGSKFY